jgi:periplasmic copper chaperone A
MIHVVKCCITLIVAALFIAACSPMTTSPTSIKHGDLLIDSAWARPAPQDGNGAIYLTIANNGTQAERLTGVQTDVTATAELHRSMQEGNMMSMAPVSGGIVIPAGATVELKPGDYHVMLIGLKRDLTAGERLTITLQFEHSGAVTLEAEVREP